MTNALASVGTGSEITLENLVGLTEWVVNARVEEVCWRISEIGSMREWLKAQKSATGLRIKAVRLELIALRKVAVGGLANKIASGNGQLRVAAEWLAELSDDAFGDVLAEIDGDKTPIALYRADKLQRDAMTESLRDKSGEAARHEAWRARHTSTDDERREESFRSSVTDVLSEVIAMGDPFTVSEAAERLADRLGLDVQVRHESAEGLREMIRSAIRRGDRSVYVDEWSELPVVFTVCLPSGEYVRIPATSAHLGHLRDHWVEVSNMAMLATRRAERLEELLQRATMTALEIAGLDPLVGDVDAVGDVMLAPLVDGIRRSTNWREAAA